MRIVHGAVADILADGSIDLEDDLLGELDIVVLLPCDDSARPQSPLGLESCRALLFGAVRVQVALRSFVVVGHRKFPPDHETGLTCYPTGTVGDFLRGLTEFTPLLDIHSGCALSWSCRCFP